MKIIQFLASTGWGGLENFFVDLSNELSKKHEVHVILLNNSYIQNLFNSNIKVHLLLSNKSRYNPFLYLELNKLIKDISPDIVHTHSSKASEILYNLNYFKNIKFVGTKQSSSKGAIFNKLKNTVVSSKSVQDTVKQKKLKLIFNGTTPIEINRIRNKNQIFTMLAVGRLDKIKGFDILIKECSKLEFDFKLEIVGDGEERENLEEMIASLNLNDKIQLIGFQTDIPQRMNDADVVVMSSHSEGFPIAMAESIFYARAFISTRVGGCNDVLPKDYLINNFDIALKLKDVHMNLKSYQDNFEIFSKINKHRFMLSTIANEYIEYYKEVIAE